MSVEQKLGANPEYPHTIAHVKKAAGMPNGKRSSNIVLLQINRDPSLNPLTMPDGSVWLSKADSQRVAEAIMAKKGLKPNHPNQDRGTSTRALEKEGKKENPTENVITLPDNQQFVTESPVTKMCLEMALQERTHEDLQRELSKLNNQDPYTLPRRAQTEISHVNQRLEARGWRISAFKKTVDGQVIHPLHFMPLETNIPPATKKDIKPVDKETRRKLFEQFEINFSKTIVSHFANNPRLLDKNLENLLKRNLPKGLKLSSNISEDRLNDFFVGHFQRRLRKWWNTKDVNKAPAIEQSAIGNCEELKKKGYTTEKLLNTVFDHFSIPVTSVAQPEPPKG